MELQLPQDGAYSPTRLDEVARLSIAEVTGELVLLLGLKRTAAIGGLKDTRQVREWIQGKTPHRQEALRTALQAARLISDADDPAVARAWFTGCNQHLGFEAPLTVLQRNDPTTFATIVRAAFAFARA